MARGPSNFSVSPQRERTVQTEAQLGDRIDSALRAELSSLAAESDPELWAAGLLHLAARLEKRGRSAESLLLLENLTNLGSELSSQAPAILAKAERRRQALLGGGRIGDRIEVLVDRFAKESTDPAALASFAVGGAVYKVARGALLARFASSPASVLTRGAAARFFAGAGAFSAEVPSFVLTCKLGRQIQGHAQDWSRPTLRTELLAAGLSLFFLKSAGALSHRALKGLQGLESWQAAPGLARFAAAALPQAGMFGGLLLGHRAEVGLGLREAAAGSSELVESLASLIHFKVGGRLSDALLGAGYHRAMGELELRTRSESSFPSRLENPNWTLPGRSGSAARFFPGFLMSSNENEGGGGGKEGKVIALFPNGSRKCAPQVDATQVDAEGIARLREQLMKQAADLMKAAEANFGEILSGAETYANYLERGAAESEKLAQLEIRLRQAEGTFLEHYHAAQALHRDLITHSFGMSADLRQKTSHDFRRSELRDFVDGAKALHQAFQTVQTMMSGMEAGNSAAVLRSLNDWYQLTPYFMILERSHVLNLASPVPEFIRASRLLGMAYGLMARDLLQNPAEQPPPLQMAEMMKLFQTLEGRGDRPYSRTLIKRYYPEGESLVPTPREGLAQGGSYQEPFRSWLGLHLPALLLYHQGRVTAVAQAISAIEIFMDPALAKISRQTLKWLGYAMERKGEPRDWAREESSSSLVGRALRMALEREPSPGLAAKILGTRSPRAILAHSLHAFLRAGNDPSLALKTAAQAPEAIREEVLGLSGALSGAYAGRGALSRWAFLPALNRSWEIGETMFSAWEKGILALPISRLARPAGFPSSSNAFPRMLQSLENLSIRHPTWIAFQDGFLERQTETEILFNNTVRRATDFLTTSSERQLAEDWSKLGDDLVLERKKLDAGVKGLRSYFQEGNLRLESSGLSPVLGAPLFEELQGRVQRLETGLTAYRRFLAGIRFSSARVNGSAPAPELKSLQEKLLAVIAAFDVPEGSSLESSLPGLLMAEYKEQLEAALRETP